MKKKLFGIIFTAAMVGAMSATTFAAQSGWTATDGRWWYDNGDGTYKHSGWHWVDDNKDGIAECYYFDEAGWLLVDDTTPDGCTVDENGAWTEQGVVQTKAVEDSAVNQQDEYTGVFEMLTVMNDDSLTVTKNEDGTYRFVKVVNGTVQYDRNARMEERKEGVDWVRFIDTEDNRVWIYYYDSRLKYSTAFDDWCEKPDYEKLAALKANRNFEGTFALEANSNYLLCVTKKSNNLYHFKHICDGELLYEYDAVPKQYEGNMCYDSVEFYDAAEGYYHVSYELDKTSDHYSYCCAGEGYADVWEPVGR